MYTRTKHEVDATLPVLQPLWLPLSPTTVMPSSQLPDLHQRDQRHPLFTLAALLVPYFILLKLPIYYLGGSVMVLAWESEDSLQESVLSHTEYQTQAIGLYLPAHFSGSTFSFVSPV